MAVSERYPDLKSNQNFLTLPDLQGYAIEDYSYQLRRRWGIGQKRQGRKPLPLAFIRQIAHGGDNAAKVSPDYFCSYCELKKCQNMCD
jgi:hypothetical protein